MAITVLIADDSAMMRKVVKKNLIALAPDANVIEVSDGNEAFKEFEAHKSEVKLVLTDWNMPNLTGIELVRQLRSVDPDKTVPIVMVTSEATADKVKQAVLAGVNNYLSKPFTPDSFKEKIGPFLGL
jgi:two-component system chemotaxis response regulator CheY